MTLKTKTVTRTTTASGVFDCGLNVGDGMVFGVFVSGYRCLPIIGSHDNTHGWNAILMQDMQPMPNVRVTATVYYIALS